MSDLSPQPFKADGSRPRIAHGVHNVFVAEIILHRPCIVAPIGEIVASGMPQHVGVDVKAQLRIRNLTDEERQQLLTLLKKGKVAARTVCRVQILLQADEETSDVVIAAALHVGVATAERTRKRFVEEGLDAALTERRRPGG